MGSAGVTESVVEEAALAWLESLGYRIKYGPDMAPGELAAERTNYEHVILNQRLLHAWMPKLISGELRLPATLRDRAAQAGVKGAERFIGRAV